MSDITDMSIYRVIKVIQYIALKRKKHIARFDLFFLVSGHSATSNFHPEGLTLMLPLSPLTSAPIKIHQIPASKTKNLPIQYK